MTTDQATPLIGTRPGHEPGEERRPQQRSRRDPFEGLKFARGAAAEQSPMQHRAAMAQERPERAGTPRRGVFEGLRLNAGPEASQRRGEQPERGERPADRLWRRPSETERAVGRYARAYEAADRNMHEGLPVLDAQKRELQQAGLELDQVRPGGLSLMASALQHDPETRQAMSGLSGRERAGQLVQGMDRERAALADPQVRAGRFVQRWQELEGQRRELHGWRDEAARRKVEGQMRGMAQGLGRDPQVESLLRSRPQDLGLGHVRQHESLAREMEQSLSRDRGRSIGIGIGM